MSEFKTKEERDAYVMRLHRLKWTHRAIAQALGLTKGTVTRIIAANEGAPAERKTA
jgi:IS30 family transposase